MLGNTYIVRDNMSKWSCTLANYTDSSTSTINIVDMYKKSKYLYQLLAIVINIIKNHAYAPKASKHSLC